MVGGDKFAILFLVEIFAYSIAQLQGDIGTCPRRAVHTFRMHSVFGKKLRKSCCSFIVSFCTCTDVSNARFGRVLHAFQAPANVTLELYLS